MRAHATNKASKSNQPDTSGSCIPSRAPMANNCKFQLEYESLMHCDHSVCSLSILDNHRNTRRRNHSHIWMYLFLPHNVVHVVVMTVVVAVVWCKEFSCSPDVDSFLYIVLVFNAIPFLLRITRLHVSVLAGIMVLFLILSVWCAEDFRSALINNCM
eukprot:331014_1